MPRRRYRDEVAGRADGFKLAGASEDRQDLKRMRMAGVKNRNSATVFKRPNGNWQSRKMTADEYWRYYPPKM
jgi:hypothetical protein